jgi:peptidyl-prolyl cis-trans isomerase A (cyclophilin A)
MRKRTLAIVMVAACTQIWTPRAAAQASSATSKSPTATHAGTTQRSSASLLRPASLKLQAPSVFEAKFVTSKGDFIVEVARSWSPRGADRFYNLVKYHFFDGAAFFRIVPGFVVQFGISARPEVSRVWEDAKIDDDPVSQSNTRGTLTFATAGPNTRTTQVFISLAENSRLDGMGFSPFGKVKSGMEVVDKLYSEYGDGPPEGSGPDQNRIQREGKAYLEKSYPLLDTIKSATIIPPAPTAARKPAATSK